MSNYELLSARIMEHAQDHYEDGGWDVIFECYTEADLVTELETNQVEPTWEAVLAYFLQSVSIWAEREADARNSAF